MRATFHNHTRWSDGLASPEEVYAYAVSAGVNILGFSDHFCVYPGGTVLQGSFGAKETDNLTGQSLTDRGLDATNPRLYMD